MKITHVIAFMMMASSIFAAGNTSEPVQVTFFGKQIDSPTHKGLKVNYDMTVRQPTQKVVCIMTNVFKAWVDIMNSGVVADSTYTLGGTQTLTFTSKGKSSIDNRGISHTYHVDPKGYFIIHNIESKTNDFAASASCSYADDDTAKK